MLEYFYIFQFIFIIYFITKYISDISNGFWQYIEPILEEYGFQLISSTFFRSKLVDPLFNDLDKDVSLNPIGAGTAVAPVQVYRHLRKLKFKDINENQFEAIAAIEFKDMRSKKFKRVRWKTNLETFTTNRKPKT